MPTFAKCINTGGRANDFLPKPLKLNKPYKVVEDGIGPKGQYVKIQNGPDRQDTFARHRFKIATT